MPRGGVSFVLSGDNLHRRSSCLLEDLDNVDSTGATRSPEGKLTHIELWTKMAKHFTLHWGHNDHDGVSNHQPRGCLLNRLFERRSKKTSKLSVTGLCAGISPGPVNSPHKGPVTRKMFSFDDVIMTSDIFKYISFCILIQISLHFVSYGPPDERWAMFQVMAWRRTGDEPSAEPVMMEFTMSL